MEETNKISFTCPQCKKTYKTDVKYAGRSFTCKGCGQNIAIPPLAIPSQGVLVRRDNNDNEKPKQFQTGVQIVAKFFPFGYFLFFCKPIIVIDGKAHRKSWGIHFFELEPGNHTVKMYFRYFWNAECGANSIDVLVEKGKVTKLKYNAPLWMYGRGSLMRLDSRSYIPVQEASLWDVWVRGEKKASEVWQGSKTGVLIKAEFFPLGFFLFFCNPVIVIDGKAYRKSWGIHFFELEPGRHTVKVYFRYFWDAECGVNATDFKVEEGKIARVNYYAPLWMYGRGRIKNKGYGWPVTNTIRSLLFRSFRHSGGLIIIFLIVFAIMGELLNIAHTIFDIIFTIVFFLLVGGSIIFDYLRMRRAQLKKR